MVVLTTRSSGYFLEQAVGGIHFTPFCHIVEVSVVGGIENSSPGFTFVKSASNLPIDSKSHAAAFH